MLNLCKPDAVKKRKKSISQSIHYNTFKKRNKKVSVLAKKISSIYYKIKDIKTSEINATNSKHHNKMYSIITLPFLQLKY